MSTAQPVKHLDVFSRDPRAQFFANRARAHAHGMKSFDGLNQQHRIELSISATLAHQAIARLALHPQK